MALCNPPISNLVHERTTTLDDSTSVTNSTDTGSDSSMVLSLDINGNDSTCRGNVRRSPRSLNPKNAIHSRSQIDMDTEKFNERKCPSPHIHLDETTISLITKEDKLITEVKALDNERNCLEDEILAATLMKSVVESTDRRAKKTDSTLDIEMSTNVCGDAGSHAETDSRVGVTLSCNKLPDVESGVTSYMELDEIKSCAEIQHVVDDSVMSTRDEEKDDPSFSGVYCGTRKRKRDALYPDSPSSMEITLALQPQSKVSSPSGIAVRSQVWKEKSNPVINTNTIAPSTLGSSNSLLAARCNSVKPPDVTNSSVPNPLLGSPFKLETVSGAENSSTGRQISASELKETTSLVSSGELTNKEMFSHSNSLTIAPIKSENNMGFDVAIGSVASQYSPKTVSIAPKCPSLPESCPVKRENTTEIASTNNNGSMCYVLPNYESDIESKPVAPRRRIFSIDIDPDVFDFGTGLGGSPSGTGFTETPSIVPYDENNSLPHLGAKLDPNSIINRVVNGSEKYNYVADDSADRMQRGNLRGRGMSFELFSFGLTADEPLPPTQSTHYGEAMTGRYIGESNIFDPVSFTDGGIHEETALSKSRPVSMILEENDEIELMNTPGFVEGPAPQTHCHIQSGITKSVPNPVSSQLLFPHHGDNMLPSRISESSGMGITDNLQYGHGTSNIEAPLTAYSSTAMKLHTMTNTDDEFFVSDDNAAASLLLSQVLPSTMNGTVSHTSCPMELLNKGGRIGIYLPVARQERIAKFHSKRKMRIWRKRIKYDCRKKLADSRPRIKGRFVKSLEQDD